ncbi:MAG TPA: prenyltransferase/squalene oxidase repeat-containing protein [Bryobacteraceae bacterium]|nr:prenyltransferase/squalene oxidase repeat-containing protein [Bryobacteraceae bacterium]
MAEVYLDRRRAALRRTQNPDGGWGYFPGKTSWLEPTAYAMLALDGDPAAREAADRAWKLVQSWQLPDGSWRAGATVEDGTWVTALAVTLCSVRRDYGTQFEKGASYLLGTCGAENRPLVRFLRALGLGDKEVDTSHPGWPWRDGNSSWLEPTAHALVALKKSAAQVRSPVLKTRVGEAEQMVLVRRCRDGGWNYGVRSALHVDLPSYPETTALGLLALQGTTAPIEESIALGRHLWLRPKSPLAHAWLTIALRTWGDALPAPDEAEEPPKDIMLTALQALAHPNGNFRLLKTGRPA